MKLTIFSIGLLGIAFSFWGAFLLWQSSPSSEYIGGNFTTQEHVGQIHNKNIKMKFNQVKAMQKIAIGSFLQGLVLLLSLWT